MKVITGYDYIYNVYNYDYIASGNGDYGYDYMKSCNRLQSITIIPPLPDVLYNDFIKNIQF